MSTTDESPASRTDESPASRTDESPASLTNESQASQTDDPSQHHPSPNISSSASTKQHSSLKDVVAAFIACIGGVSVGLVLGYSNPALQDADLRYVLDDIEKQSWFGSLVAVGAMFGAPFSGFLVVKCGRKATLMLAMFPMGLGWFAIISGSHFALLYFGRVVTGLACGLMSVAVPLYVTDVADTARRGLLGACFQLFTAIGILAVYSLGIPLGYRWLAVASLGVCTLNTVLLLIVPESPRWFAQQKRRLEAIEALAWLTGKDKVDLDDEYLEMERSFGTAQKTSDNGKGGGGGGGGISLRDFALPEIYRPMLISCGIMVYQQMSGINPVIFYSSDIFAASGFSDDPKLPTITIGVVLVLATGVSCVLMDRAGRRVLLLAAGVPMALSIIALGVCFHLTSSGPVSGLNWLSLISVLIFVVCFSLGIGPISWLIVSELVPTRARSIINGLATCIVWLLLFIVTKEYGRMRMLLNDSGAFWFFGGCGLLGVVFVWFCVPETKGKSLEEIQQLFAASPKRTNDVGLKEVSEVLLSAKLVDVEKQSEDPLSAKLVDEEKQSKDVAAA